MNICSCAVVFYEEANAAQAAEDALHGTKMDDCTVTAFATDMDYVSRQFGVSP
jgi:hypothetical protein